MSEGPWPLLGGAGDREFVFERPIGRNKNLP